MSNYYQMDRAFKFSVYIGVEIFAPFKFTFVNYEK
jgi:hypothetical protein